MNRLREVFSTGPDTPAARWVNSFIETARNEQLCCSCKHYIEADQALPGWMTSFPECAFGGLAEKHCDKYEPNEEFGLMARADVKIEQLTLEELLQMQGQTVWVDHAGGNKGIILSITDERIEMRLPFGDCVFRRKEYGDRWVAYRYPPAKRAAT